MKYTGRTRLGSLVLSGIYQASHSPSVSAELRDTVNRAAARQIQATESEDSMEEYESDNDYIADLFHKWIAALDLGDQSKADKIEAEIEDKVKGHPFPYSETLKFFHEGYPRKEWKTSASKNYRNYKKEPWSSNPDFGLIEGTVSKDAKVGIIGDWGTGDDDAIFLLEQMLKRAPDMEAILHLGDIYQCGTPFECAQNFLEPINSTFEALKIDRVPIFTIPGNHEYFTAAKGYFDLIDVLNSDLDKKWKQQASYFCLRSEDNQWQFLGADTGLDCVEHPMEPGLKNDELSWHTDRLKEFRHSNPGGNSIFMTHHEFVSAHHSLNRRAGENLEYYNKRLLLDFENHLDKIDMWLWGHDHWFIPYLDILEIPTK